MTTRLYVSIGPVQGFVAQSRRTRDLWGSSYLLSFLTGHAIRGAEKAGVRRIVQPVVDDDPLYRWIGHDRKGEVPQIGSLPNRFEVETDGNARDVADAAAKALEAAWIRICGAVWNGFVEHAAETGNETEAIWKRQTGAGAFWEVSWTADPEGAASGPLARRKHWRSHRAPDEHGDKCTVMHDLQELSGYVRARGGDDRRKQDEFWGRVRGHERLGPLDLQDDERLCAIALAKRLFPKVAWNALDWDIEASHWPSTVHIGARPWIEKVVSAVPNQARKYAEAVSERAGHVLTERYLPAIVPLDQAAGDFPKLDANYFHQMFVRNERQCPLLNGFEVDARHELDRLLKTIYEARDRAGRRIGPPSSFYALLLADGDRLGKLVGELGGDAVGKALAAFTSKVPEVIRKHSGVTVYAGGDDALAMLPVSGVLACAASLADSYRSAFPEGTDGATLSAAVTFTHVRLPLGAALTEAHRLLDDIAKEANGRDSLAVGVLKPSGLNCQWATTWTRKHPDGGGSSSAVELLDRLVTRFRSKAAEPGLSSALIYRVREMLAALCGWDAWRPGVWGPVPEGLDISAFLRAEINHSLAARMESGAKDRADELTASVWGALGRSRTPSNGSETGIAEAGIDALLLARFLADPEHDGDGV